MKKQTCQIDKPIPHKGIKLSMVFSFRNEEEVLLELISRVRSVLKSEKDKGLIASYELIFVNDRSTDRSEEILISS